MTELLSRGDIATQGDRSHVPFGITDRLSIPRERYFDQTFFELENEKLWPHVWQMACRLEEIPSVGDFTEYTVADYSIIVVRTGPEEIKAYQNACRHRATQLAVGCGTFTNGKIVCPFHGWRWNLDGSASQPLYGQEGFDPGCLDPDDLRLTECQVETWLGCVFINMDRSAPPLREVLGPLPGYLEPLRVGNMHVHWWKGVRLEANWKIALEAFLEGWHVAGTHPQLTMGAGEKYPANHQNHVELWDTGNMYLAQGHDSEVQDDLGMGSKAEAEQTIAFFKLMYEGGDAQVTAKDLHIVEGLRNVDCAPGEFSRKLTEALYAYNAGAGIKMPDPDPEVLGRWASNTLVFPNFNVHPVFGNSLIYRCRPDTNDPEHCLFEMWALTLYHEGYEPPKPTYTEAGPYDADEWTQIPLQDYSNIERQQRGLHQPGHVAQRLARDYEAGIANFHAALDSYLAR